MHIKIKIIINLDSPRNHRLSRRVNANLPVIQGPPKRPRQAGLSLHDHRPGLAAAVLRHALVFQRLEVSLRVFEREIQMIC